MKISEIALNNNVSFRKTMRAARHLFKFKNDHDFTVEEVTTIENEMFKENIDIRNLF